MKKKLALDTTVPVQVHVVGVFLVYHAIYWYRRALVVVEREVPPLTAATTPVQSKIATISDVEGAVGIALLNCACLIRRPRKKIESLIII